MHSFGFLKKHLQPEAIPYILNGEWLTCCCCWFVPPYASMFSPDVCHQKLLEILHREELNVSWILSTKAEFLKSEKGTKRSIQATGYPTFHTFQNGRQNTAREPREPGIKFGKPLIGACWRSGTQIDAEGRSCRFVASRFVYSQTKWSVPLKIALMNWLFETWTR